MSAVAIATRGVICLGGGARETAIVADTPVVTAAVELKPTMRAASQTTSSAPVVAPLMMASEELRPVMRSGTSTSTAPTGSTDEPKMVSAEELRPVIRKAEEE